MAGQTEGILTSVVIDPACRETHLPLQHPSGKYAHERGLVLAGWSMLRKEYRIERQSGGDLAYFLFTLDGSGCLRTGGQTLYLKPGNVVIVPPGVAHTAELCGDFWQLLWAHAAGSIAERVKDETAVYRPFLHADRILEAMRGYADETLHNQDFTEEGALYAELIVRYLMRETPSAHPDEANESELRARLAQLWMEVAEDLGRPWTVPQLAAKVNLSERHFYRRIREVYGEGPVQILRRLRLDRARELIRAGEYTLQQIATAVGYRDYFAFLAAFKRHTGMTTSSYRRTTVRSGS